MKKYENNVIAILSLAFFNFLFLGIEYLFDDIVALFVEPSSVVNLQNVILGASVIGFLLYGWLGKKLEEREKGKFLSGAINALFVILIFAIAFHPSIGVVVLAGILAFIILGLTGSAVCYRITQSISSISILSKIVGIAYAFGIAIQYINNNLVKNSILQGSVLAVFAVLLALLSKKPIEHNITSTEKEPADSAVKKKTILFIILIVLMTCIFSTLDNAVTLVHASGDFNIGQWPRLLLALSGLMAGILFDIKERKYIHYIMYGITLMSSICVILLTNGVSFIIGLLFFYFSAGFFVVYFTTIFMEHSYSTARPQLWAGIGRGINNATAVLISFGSVFLLGKSSLTVLIINLVLFAAISLVMLCLSDLKKKKQVDEFLEKYSGVYEEPCSSNIISDEDKLHVFSDRYGLTERETEVLRELLSAEDNVQEMAKKLYISRAVLYRHISSINVKTDTKSRVGIVKKFFSET